MKSRAVVRANASYGIDNEKTEIAELERLKIQLALTFPAEVDFLIRQKRHFKKDLFVDLGCGPGHCLDFYRNSIEFKATIGLDSSLRFVNYAQQHYSSKKSQFKVYSILQPEVFEKGDIFYSRFVFQHLSEKNRIQILKNFKKNAKEGSLYLIVDIDDRFWQTEPPCDAFHLAKKLRNITQNNSLGDREVGLKIITYAEKVGLKILDSYVHTFSNYSLDSENLFEILSFFFMQNENQPVLSKAKMTQIHKEFRKWYFKKSSVLSGSIVFTLLSA